MPNILEACRLDQSTVTTAFYDIIAPFLVFCFQPFYLETALVL